jgi:hypothetical protein
MFLTHIYTKQKNVKNIIRINIFVQDELHKEDKKMRDPIRRKQSKLNYSQTITGRAKRLMDGARERAQRYSIPITITQEWIEDRLRAGRCEVTGMLLDLTRHPKFRVNPFAPSLDRFDAARGYTPENTRMTTWHYNMSKGQYSDDSVYEMALAVVKARFVERCAAEGY